MTIRQRSQRRRCFKFLAVIQIWNFPSGEESHQKISSRHQRIPNLERWLLISRISFFLTSGQMWSMWSRVSKWESFGNPHRSVLSGISFSPSRCFSRLNSGPCVSECFGNGHAGRYPSTAGRCDLLTQSLFLIPALKGKDKGIAKARRTTNKRARTETKEKMQTSENGSHKKPRTTKVGEASKRTKRKWLPSQDTFATLVSAGVISVGARLNIGKESGV